MGKMDQLYMDTQEYLSELLDRPATEQEVNDYLEHNIIRVGITSHGLTYPLGTVSRDCVPFGAPANASADWRPPVGTVVYCKDEGTGYEVEHHCKDGDILVYCANTDNVTGWSTT